MNPGVPPDEPVAVPAEGRPDGDGAGEDAPVEEDVSSAADERLDDVLAQLASIAGAVAEFHQRARHRETVIDRLHEENQRLRAGRDRAVLDPVVGDLIRLHDGLWRESSRLAAEDGDEAAALLAGFAEDVELVLDRCGVERYTADVGDPFQPKEHQPRAVVGTDDAGRHNTVAEVIAAGFRERDSGRVRRPLQARFFQHRPSDGGAGGT